MTSLKLDNRHLVIVAKILYKKKSNSWRRTKVVVLTRTVDYQEFRFLVQYKLHLNELSFSLKNYYVHRKKVRLALATSNSSNHSSQI